MSNKPSSSSLGVKKTWTLTPQCINLVSLTVSINCCRVVLALNYGIDLKHRRNNKTDLLYVVCGLTR